MKNVPSEKRNGYITERDVKEFRKHARREGDRLMAWVLVIELITYISNDEAELFSQTVEKVKRNSVLRKNKEFMSKLGQFPVKDIEYLKKIKETIKP